MANLMLNSWGRTFIQDSTCEPYGYAEDCVEVAGITESFGDITNIWCQSDSISNSYEIVAQIEGSETAPTTTITSYLPADGISQLWDLARRKCAFNMHIHYGECNNPTDFNDFTYGLVLEGARITNYSTTNLTSRSPDTRSAIDLTFSLSIRKVYQIFSPSFVEIGTDETIDDGPIVNVFGYYDESCAGGNCLADCQLLALQTQGTAYRFLRRYEGAWWNDVIVTGIAPFTGNSFVYTDGTTIYMLVEDSGTPEVQVYSLDYESIDVIGPTFTNILTIPGALARGYHVYAGNLYFAIDDGLVSSGLYSLALSSGAITLLAQGVFAAEPASVFGYGSIVYIGTTGGDVYRYKNNATSQLTTPATMTGVVYGLSVSSADAFRTLSNANEIHCTNDGGQTWVDVATVGIGLGVGDLNTINPEHTFAFAAAGGSLFESFDGGLTFTQNTTFDFTAEQLTSISFCGSDDIYIGSEDIATGLIGGLFENKG